MKLPTLEDVRAELARRSLAEFVRQAWPIIEPSTKLIWNWHLDVMCDHLQALVERRLGSQNLIINVPPGSMKSTIVSVCLPAWIWAQRKDHPTGGPAWRGLFLSGSEAIALRDSMKCRDILESSWYQQSFRPSWSFDRAQNAKGYFKNSAQGFRKCQPAGSKIVGERAHGIFVDDPNDSGQDSKADRDAINYWWDNGAANRVADARTSTRCLIQQRLHEEDLTGHILEKERQDWDVLLIRQEYEVPTDKEPARPTGLGWVDPRQEEGELMFPDRFPRQVVEAEKRRLASSAYAGQHQQRPAAKEGEIFKRGFVQFFDPELPLPAFKRLVMSWDTAFKERTQNDPSCGLLGGEADRGIYLTDHTLGRMAYPALKEKAKAWAGAHGISALLIEDKASGQSLIQELRLETSLPVVAIKVDTDKVSRATATIPTWEARRIFLPQGAPWVDKFLEELYSFPKGAHDDQVDAFTQLVNYLVMGGGATGLLGWLEQELASAKAEQKGGAA